MENRVDFAHFRRLLETLENSDITIRLRTLGNSWTSSCTLLLLSESAMILQDGAEDKMIVNLRNVVEFELGQELEGLSASTPYEVGY